MKKALAILLCAFCLASAMSACGTKGPLVLPPKPATDNGGDAGKK